jgi:hypothetical protein
MRAEMIGEFIAAISEEIEAAKKKAESSGIKLSSGDLIEQSNGTYVYRFSAKRDLSTLDLEAASQLEVNGKLHECTIIAVEGKQITLAITESAGSHANLARLILCQTAINQILKDRFTNALTTGSVAHFDFAAKVFSGHCQRLCETPAGIKGLNEARGSNPSQIKAISNSISHSLAVIWGPPGTGKTKTIARAVEAHLKAGRRVLLVSLANNAVDSALEAIAELLQESYYANGQLVRLGIPRSASLRQRFPLVLPRTQIKEEQSQLSEQKTLYETRLSSLKKRLDDCRQLVNLNKQIKKQKEALRSNDGITYSIDVAKTYNSIVGEIYQMNCLIDQARVLVDDVDLNEPERMVLASKLKYLIDHRDSRQPVAEELRVKLNCSFNAESDRLKEAETQLRELATNIGVSPHAAENEMAATRRDIDSSSESLDRLLNVESKSEREILSSARLVAATLAKTFASPILDDEIFDVLVVDEASMVAMPQLYWALGKATTCATIVGDFMQLPPIVQSQKKLATKWLQRSIFDQLNIANINAAKESTLVSLLDTQYRMSPSIANISSELFYGALVKNAPSTETLGFVDSLTQSDKSNIVIDTTDVNPLCTQDDRGKTNYQSAAIAARICERLRRDHPTKTVAVVTPYRAQQELIESRLREAGFGKEIPVGTVHKFQGLESDIVIFDCVDGTGSRGSMLNDMYQNSNARVLLNVALTRARSKFILIANVQYFENLISDSGVFPRMLTQLRESGVQITGTQLNEILSEAPAPCVVDQSHDFTPVANTASLLFNEVSFWEAFLRDLNQAEKTVFLCSPYVTRHRSGQIVPVLKQLIENGLTVKILTRPPDSHSSNMIEGAIETLNQLREAGAEIIERENIHQKLAVIDAVICWHGSLNILSHRDTEESMTRIEGTDFASQLLKSIECGELVDSTNERIEYSQTAT